MHFRERGTVVQLIRTSYDSTTKKGKNEIVGRLVKNNPKITPQLDGVLTDKERKEVKAWIVGNGTTGRLKEQLAAHTLAEQMALEEEWFKGHKGEDARILATTLMGSWLPLRQVMKKNGLIE